MVFDKRANGLLEIRKTLSLPLAPLQYAVSWPLRVAASFSSILRTQDQLIRENNHLKDERLLLKAQMQRQLAIEAENNELKALMRSTAQIQGKLLIAQLLSIDTEPYVNQVIVDKGLRNGLYVGQPVLDANGVMGQLIQVDPLSSRVLLINDPRSGVPVQDARNGVRAIAVGDGYTGKLRLANVPQTVDIAEGDILLTSGLGQNFPEGYPVGKVSSIIRNPGLQFATIVVEPAAHLDRSREVLLVWPSRATPAENLVHPKNAVDNG